MRIKSIISVSPGIDTPGTDTPSSAMPNTDMAALAGRLHSMRPNAQVTWKPAPTSRTDLNKVVAISRGLVSPTTATERRMIESALIA